MGNGQCRTASGDCLCASERQCLQLGDYASEYKLRYVFERMTPVLFYLYCFFFVDERTCKKG